MEGGGDFYCVLDKYDTMSTSLLLWTDITGAVFCSIKYMDGKLLIEYYIPNCLNSGGMKKSKVETGINYFKYAQITPSACDIVFLMAFSKHWKFKMKRKIFPRILIYNALSFSMP